DVENAVDAGIYPCILSVHTEAGATEFGDTRRDPVSGTRVPDQRAGTRAVRDDPLTPQQRQVEGQGHGLGGGVRLRVREVRTVDDVAEGAAPDPEVVVDERRSVRQHLTYHRLGDELRHPRALAGEYPVQVGEVGVTGRQARQGAQGGWVHDR